MRRAGYGPASTATPTSVLLCRISSGQPLRGKRRPSHDPVVGKSLSSALAARPFCRAWVVAIQGLCIAPFHAALFAEGLPCLASRVRHPMAGISLAIGCLKTVGHRQRPPAAIRGQVRKGGAHMAERQSPDRRTVSSTPDRPLPPAVAWPLPKPTPIPVVHWYV